MPRRAISNRLKGLLLGLFFIGVGMSIDFGTLVTHPLRIPDPAGGFHGDQSPDAVADC